jgi:CheY-like chemotaxis protein
MSDRSAPKCRILVVDDEPFVCDALKMMLDFDGHLVQTASNGREALGMFEDGRFDLVITDFEMPAMKGDELAAAIKKISPGQPVVMVTAYAEMLQTTHGLMPGVDMIIGKPYLLDSLRQAIAKVVGKKENAPGKDKK